MGSCLKLQSKGKKKESKIQRRLIKQPPVRPSIWRNSESARDEKTQSGTRWHAPDAKKAQQRKKLRTPGRDNPEREVAKPTLSTSQIKSPINPAMPQSKLCGCEKGDGSNSN